MSVIARQLLMNVVAEEASATPITLILNWPALLKKEMHKPDQDGGAE